MATASTRLTFAGSGHFYNLDWPGGKISPLPVYIRIYGTWELISNGYPRVFGVKELNGAIWGRLHLKTGSQKCKMALYLYISFYARRTS
jgi:hypothetical protein